MSAPTHVRPTAPTAAPVTNTRALIALLGALTALAPLTIDLYLPALPTIVADFNTSASAIQATLTGSLVGVALGQLIIGPLSDTYGRRPPLLIAVSAYVVASIACVFAPTIPLLTGARVFQGMAAAAGGVIAMAVIRDLFSGLRGVQALSRLMLVVGVAPVLAPSLGSLLLSVTDWRGVFWLLAIVGVALAVAGSLGLRETLPPHKRSTAGVRATLRVYGSLLRERTLVGLMLTGGFVMAEVFAYVSGSSFVLQEQYGLSTLQFGILFGVNSIGLFGATQVNAWLVRRFDPQDILTVGLSVAAVSSTVGLIAVATGAFGMLGLILPLFVTLTTVGLAMPNVPGLALASHGDSAGTTAALLGGANFAVGAGVAPIVGALPFAPATSMALVMLLAAGAALASYLLIARPSSMPAFVRESDPVEQ